MKTEDVDLMLSFQHDGETLTSPSGPGAELDLFPWLRFTAHWRLRLLRILRKEVERILESFIQERKVC